MPKYDTGTEELDFLELERNYKPTCSTCTNRLYTQQSIKEMKCMTCRKVRTTQDYGSVSDIRDPRELDFHFTASLSREY